MVKKGKMMKNKRIDLIVNKLKNCGSKTVKNDIYSSKFYKKYKKEIDEKIRKLK